MDPRNFQWQRTALVAVAAIASLLLFVPSALACGAAPKDASWSLDSEDVVLVAPFNLMVPLSAELTGKTGPVGSSLVAYLQARGAEVDGLAGSYTQRLWQAQLSTKAGGPTPSLVDVCGGLARDLAAREHYDYLVIPSLVTRLAALEEDRASWDGVRRSISSERVAGTGRLPGATLGALAGEHEIRVDGLSGNLGAVSLHVSVLDSEGRLVYSGIGGLSLLHEAHGADTAGGASTEVTLETRTEPFSVAGEVEQGVRIAFEEQRDPQARERRW